jgi:hypothetical protein
MGINKIAECCIKRYLELVTESRVVELTEKADCFGFRYRLGYVLWLLG